MKVPDAIEPAVGWRAWLLDPERDLLISVAHGDVWVPRVPFEATCDRGHPVPDPNCSCGTYAASTKQHLYRMGYQLFNKDFNDPWVVVGLVRLWGDIIPGTRGWRAQFAYPKELQVPWTAWRHVVALREAYGVPCKPKNTLKEPTSWTSVKRSRSS